MDVVVMLVLVGVVGAIILPPLFRRAGSAVSPAAGADPSEARRKVEDALNDLEFDRATGKLADDDYAALRSRFENTARRIEPASPPRSGAPRAGVARPAAVPGRAPAAGDAVLASLEAEIRAARRTRQLTRFCTGCGAALPRAARFCPACGTLVEGRA